MPQLIILILLVLFFLPIVRNSIIAAPPLGTKSKDVRRLIEVANVQAGEVVFDLGAGDGRLIIAAAREHPQAQIVGYELSPLHYVWCRLRLAIGGCRQAKVRFKDFYQVDFGQADVVLCFLTPGALAKLRTKFEQEMRPGARFVSYIFPFEDLVPTEENRPTLQDLPIYVYEKV